MKHTVNHMHKLGTTSYKEVEGTLQENIWLQALFLWREGEVLEFCSKSLCNPNAKAAGLSVVRARHSSYPLVYTVIEN